MRLPAFAAVLTRTSGGVEAVGAAVHAAAALREQRRNDPECGIFAERKIQMRIGQLGNWASATSCLASLGQHIPAADHSSQRAVEYYAEGLRVSGAVCSIQMTMAGGAATCRSPPVSKLSCVAEHLVPGGAQRALATDFSITAATAHSGTTGGHRYTIGVRLRAPRGAPRPVRVPCIPICRLPYPTVPAQESRKWAPRELLLLRHGCDVRPSFSPKPLARRIGSPHPVQRSHHAGPHPHRMSSVRTPGGPH